MKTIFTLWINEHTTVSERQSALQLCAFLVVVVFEVAGHFLCKDID